VYAGCSWGHPPICSEIKNINKLCFYYILGKWHTWIFYGYSGVMMLRNSERELGSCVLCQADKGENLLALPFVFLRIIDE
jgi:hypothetical protein